MFLCLLSAVRIITRLVNKSLNLILGDRQLAITAKLIVPLERSSANNLNLFITFAKNNATASKFQTLAE
ncbi:MAG: hypothetical protein EAZ79_02840 [Oscillatoriales cyanobacterium]|nr:MAG: hypothetical protein EAZ79_02840 [Oscillatoriales cyanobacterium]